MLIDLNCFSGERFGPRVSSSNLYESLEEDLTHFH